ncbi:hypothetical protein D3C75_1138460 [compost metagenome]
MVGHLVVGDHAAYPVQPVEVAGQLGLAMPGQVLPQPVVKHGLLLTVHGQVVTQRPRHQAVEVAVGQVDTVAGSQGQGAADGDEQGFGQA